MRTLLAGLCVALIASLCLAGPSATSETYTASGPAELTLERDSTGAVVAWSVRYPVGSAVPPPQPPPPADPFVWTDPSPSADSRLIYVSSSGDDSSDGLTEATPKATLAAGAALLRSGFPDHLYLSRGDTWTEDLTGFGKSGRSTTEPLVLAAYGTGPRPKIVGVIQSDYESAQSFVHVLGLEIDGGSPTPLSTIGVRFYGHGSDYVLEDCHVHGFKTNVIFDGNGGTLTSISIRRCVITDSFSTPAAGHSQGLFMSDCDGVTIEECVLDHNGWVAGSTTSTATKFNHNTYLNAEVTGIVMRGNVIANASATGAQLRRGGVCENNLLIANPVNILFGHWQSDYATHAGTGSVSKNVIIDSRDTDTLPRGFGIWLEMVNTATITDNVIAHQGVGTQAKGIYAIYTYEGLTVSGNVVYGWNDPGASSSFALMFRDDARAPITVSGNDFQGATDRLVGHIIAFDASVFSYTDNRYQTSGSNWVQLTGALPDVHLDFAEWVAASGETGTSGVVAYPDPTRDVATYWASVGGSGGRQGFLDAVRAQSRQSWDPNATAEAANQWIRAGFGVPE